ncbi:hypothetical protein FIBSPDRAFT_1041240 [Athelia psychrophila]|uniref:Uncharacterized protein n=1 Tax=Athelia psychrophila TaxID=1759441 RepID=A0A167XBL1_9AGAM|nr:hypothetical protein FIBSPDRAFT_1053214 [Fibularhizoctonia sp. CBS 109695]KZP25902.1 hypothetical protein FIBSPDRAFT_1041240 [Fibularhizoctonia sp. CBS 109695]
MAGILDFLSLLLTASVFVGVIVGIIFVVQQVQAAVAQTKESLKKKGLNITDTGVSVKTDRHLDREDYLDATQRNMVKAFQSSSFAKVDAQGNHAAALRPSLSGSASFMKADREKEKEKEKRGSRWGMGSKQSAAK